MALPRGHSDRPLQLRAHSRIWGMHCPKLQGELSAERVRLGGMASVHCLCLLSLDSTV